MRTNVTNLRRGRKLLALDSGSEDCYQNVEEPSASSAAPEVRRKQQPLTKGGETVSGNAPHAHPDGILPVDPSGGRPGESRQGEGLNTRSGPTVSYAKAAAKGTGGRMGQQGGKSKIPNAPDLEV